MAGWSCAADKEVQAHCPAVHRTCPTVCKDHVAGNATSLAVIAFELIGAEPYQCSCVSGGYLSPVSNARNAVLLRSCLFCSGIAWSVPMLGRSPHLSALARPRRKQRQRTRSAPSTLPPPHT